MSSKFLLIAFSSLAFIGSVVSCELAIAQPESPETPQITRPRVTFFEQTQKVGNESSLQFGNEAFLQSALSGTTQAIADPAKQSPNASITNGSNPYNFLPPASPSNPQPKDQ